MIKVTRKIRNAKYLTFIVDICLFLALAYFFGWSEKPGLLMFLDMQILGFTWMLGLYAFRAFDLTHHHNSHSIVISIFAGITLGMIFSVLPMVLIKVHPSKLSLALMYVGMFTGTSLIHGFMLIWIRQYMEAEKAIVIGKKDHWGTMVEQLAKSVSHKLKPVAFLNPSTATLQQTLDSDPGISTILIADHQKVYDPSVNIMLRDLINKGLRVIFIPRLSEMSLQRIPLDLASNYKQYYDIFFNEVEPSNYKRVFDIFIALSSLLILSPLMLVIAALLALTSGFPVIYRQKRIGLHEKPFTIHKFRTMANSRPDEGPAFLQENGEERITGFGKLLRKTRLDELPQLWDVLIGNMSIVGPRPEMPEFHQKGIADIPFYRYRTRLRPGITGWAQVNYGHTTDIDDYRRKTEYDLYYVKNRSILLDLQIMLLTAETMLGMKGSR